MFLGESDLGRYSEKVTSHTGRVPARRVQGQNGGCAESRGNPAYPPYIACGLLEACSRGSSRRCTEGFHDGLDSLAVIAGSELHQSWALGAVRRWPRLVEP